MTSKPVLPDENSFMAEIQREMLKVEDWMTRSDDEPVQEEAHPSARDADSEARQKR